MNNGDIKAADLNNASIPAFSTQDENFIPCIEMKEINYAFGEGESYNQVLFDINLTVYPGEIVILTGPSGAGKTTLLTLIGALRSIQEGRLRVLGKELGGLTQQKLQETRKNVGFIFQTQNLFESLTALETLTLTMKLYSYPKEALISRPAKILTELGLKDRMHYKPGKLSEGQKQRVAIGRALINHPRLILADEPTAALDRVNSQHVMEMFQRRVKEDNCTFIIVTHDHRIFDVADRILELVDGILISNKAVVNPSTIDNFLKKCSLFKGTNASILANVANEMKLEIFSPGEWVIRKGKFADKFYLIRSGMAEVFKEVDGETKSLGNIGPGSFFGNSARHEHAPLTASVKALEKLEILSLPKEKLVELTHTSSSFREQLEKASFDYG